jgi:hypothetical protein
MVTDERALELAAYLNREVEKWKRTQYEPVDQNLVKQATEQLLLNQNE